MWYRTFGDCAGILLFWLSLADSLWLLNEEVMSSLLKDTAGVISLLPSSKSFEFIRLIFSGLLLRLLFFLLTDLVIRADMKTAIPTRCSKVHWLSKSKNDRNKPQPNTTNHSNDEGISLYKTKQTTHQRPLRKRQPVSGWNIGHLLREVTCIENRKIPVRTF